MYKIFMLIAVPTLILAWIAYFLWQRHLDKLESQQPKQVSPKLQKARSELAEWAQRMAEYRPPKPPQGTDQQESDRSDGQPGG